jgi:beta-glucanase (GH16 family)
VDPHSVALRPPRRDARRRRALVAIGLLAALPGVLLAGSAGASPAAHAFGPSGIDAPATESPSGRSMPTTAPPGWTTVEAENFDGTTLPAGWTAYSGEPGGDPAGWWSPSHVTVSGGMLHLVTSMGTRGAGGPTGEVSGGIGTGITQTYGKYEVRMRMDAGAGVDGVALLWPTKGWPPEIDFFEDGADDNTRSTITANLHYADDQRIHAGEQGVDFTKWHTVGVQWAPGVLRYTLDGGVWATMQSAAVPDQPMSLDLQSQFDGGDLTATTPARVDMEVDWVVVYKPS